METTYRILSWKPGLPVRFQGHPCQPIFTLYQCLLYCLHTELEHVFCRHVDQNGHQRLERPVLVSKAPSKSSGEEKKTTTTSFPPQNRPPKQDMQAVTLQELLHGYLQRQHFSERKKKQTMVYFTYMLQQENIDCPDLPRNSKTP